MKKILLLAAALSPLLSFSQNKNKWTDMFSYNNVLVMADAGDRVLAATENGLFYYNPTTGEISKFSKVNGLHEVKISAFDYDPVTKTGLIGYKSGNLDVLNADGTITYVVDIPLSQSAKGDKTIRNISINGNVAIISVDYGVSVFRMDKKEFGDTCFFPVKAKEGIAINNKVYVSTEAGLKSHALDMATLKDPSFVDYTTWTSESGSIAQLDVDGSNAVGADATQVYYNSGTGFAAIGGGFSAISDVRIYGQNIVVTDGNVMKVLNTSGQVLDTYDTKEALNTGLVKSNIVYAGSQLSGILKRNATDATLNTQVKPDGPYKNQSYKLRVQGDRVWVATGGRSTYMGPVNTSLGYYYYDGNKWNYPTFFSNCQNGLTTNGCIRNDVGMNILDVLPDPSNTNTVYFANYTTDGKQGIYKLEDDKVQLFIDNKGDNSMFRASGLEAKNGYIISSIGYLLNPANRGKTGSGLFIGKNGVINKLYPTYTNSSEGGTQRPVITDNVIWYGNAIDSLGGFIAYLYNGNFDNIGSAKVVSIDIENGLPSKSGISAAMDNYGDMWLGGSLGLRVLQNADQAIQQGNVKVNPIIITQNGVGEELFRNLPVQQITVDTANKKWVSIDGGGVFYLAPDGQQTLLNFTSQNSPLPNNSITDIYSDSKTGKVYFASSDGIVVYNGDVADVTSNFGNVVVYPNPVVYSQFKGNVTIKGLADKTNIRITDAAGNVVHSAVAYGGVYEWNLQNTRGVRVASGIYFVLMTNGDGTDKKAVKIAAVN